METNNIFSSTSNGDQEAKINLLLDQSPISQGLADESIPMTVTSTGLSFEENDVSFNYVTIETPPNEVNTEQQVPDITTFSDIKKSLDKGKITYGTYDDLIISVGLNELEQHPINQGLYFYKEAQVKCLAQNILNYSLINRIIVNKKLQILSGNLRYLALKELGVEKVEVYAIDIREESELEFIISSNQQREKSILDSRNEIKALFDMYSPGQGSRDSRNENTIKRIALITGYSTNRISTIRKIDSQFPLLLEEVNKGNMTLNFASKQCDIVDQIRTLGELLGKDLLDDLPPNKIADVFSRSVKDYCKETNPDYYAMMENNQMTATQAFSKLISQKNPKEATKASGNNDAGNQKTDHSMYCPCCAQKVKKDNKELDWLKEWNQTIIDFIVKLKLPTNV